MLFDVWYSEEDIFFVINYLKIGKGKKFSFNILEFFRNFYGDELLGDWMLLKVLKDKDVFILGVGEGVVKYKEVIEVFIKKYNLIVLVINM